MNTHNDINLDERARAILRQNDRGGYTVPTHGLYPYQWNWDSMFAAWGFATFDIDRAWTEVETLLSGQWPNGMLPHILFHQDDPGYFPGPDVWQSGGIGPIPSTGITQPPVAATLARTIWEANKEAGAARLLPVYTRLLAFHQWFMRWRVKDGVAFVTHPWESGRDNSPDWDADMAAITPTGVGPYTRRDTSHVDASMRPTKDEYDRYVFLVQEGRSANWHESVLETTRSFQVVDPLMSFVFLRACRDLRVLAEATGDKTDQIDQWIATMEQGCATRLMDEETGHFTAFSDLGRAGLTSGSFLCWYAGCDSDGMRSALARTFDSCPYPVPSYPVDGVHFDAKRYWRGPTWAIVNAMIGRGLAEAGLHDEANHMRLQTRAMISEHGFAEYFDPLTGDPAGGQNFTWTAAVWLAWAAPSAPEYAAEG